MSFENKGSMATTVTISLEPDRSGNFVCDGTADNVQINTAITRVNGIGGGRVLLKEGIYSLSSGITMLASVILEGEGSATVIENASGGTLDIITVNNSNDWVMCNFKIDGRSDVGGTISNGIAVGGTCTRWTIRDLQVTRCAKTNGRGHGMQIGDTAHEGLITQNRVYNNGGHGIFLRNEVYDIEVSENETHDQSWSGIAVGISGETPQRILIANNRSHDNGYDGIQITGCSELMVVGNDLWDNTLEEILVEGVSDPNNYVLIEGNHCWCTSGNDPTAAAIEVYNNTNSVDHLKISNNLIEMQGGAYGIHINPQTGTVDDIQITGNKIYHTRQGILLEDTGTGYTRVQVNDNMVRWTTADNRTGIDLREMTDFQVNNNVVTQTFRGFYLSACHHGTINGNVVENAYRNGLEISDMEHVTVSSNHIHNIDTGNGGYHGMILTDFQYSTVIGNVLEDGGTGNTSHGINLAGSSYHDNIIGNYIEGFGGYGIIIDTTSTDNRISDNRTISNTTGCCRVDDAGCSENIITNNSFDEGNISDAGTNTRAYLNYDPSANTFIATINAPTVVGGGGGALP